jgi:hypothetical protein
VPEPEGIRLEAEGVMESAKYFAETTGVNRAADIGMRHQGEARP